MCDSDRRAVSRQLPPAVFWTNGVQGKWKCSRAIAAGSLWRAVDAWWQRWIRQLQLRSGESRSTSGIAGAYILGTNLLKAIFDSYSTFMTLLSTCLQKKGAEEFCMKEKVQSTKLIYDFQVQLDQTVNCTDKIKYSIIYLQDSFFFNLIYKYYLLKDNSSYIFLFHERPIAVPFSNPSQLYNYHHHHYHRYF